MLNTLVLAVGTLFAQADGERQVRDFFKAHCTECHDAETHKKGLRLDNLAASFTDRGLRDRWGQVHDRIRLGEMPPKNHPQPKPEEVPPVLAWIAARVDGAETEKRAREGRTVLRRLNRAEYENTVRDLLGVDLDLKDLLPPDTLGERLRQRRRGAARLLLPDGAVPGSGRQGAGRGHRQRAAAAG